MRELLSKKIIILGVLVIGGFIGFLVEPYVLHHGSSCVSDLHFIKPNLDCDIYDDKVEALANLRDKMRMFIAGVEKTGKAERVSVFVRDLNTSRFAGVGDTDVYYMASLLKTPLVIGGYKLAEVEPKILDQELVYAGKPNLYSEQIIKVEDELQVGKSYSIRELMRRSVVNSDNTAAQMLYEYYPDEFMDRIMDALGVQTKKPTGEAENLVTPRSYGNIFRSLYNASYLTKEYSDETLKTLTQVTFDKGATSKLPKDVLVAHKFAERTIIDSTNSNLTKKQFHECGIVYAKNSKEPYIFCIMTEGDSYDDLENVVADISLLIYEEMGAE